MIRQLLHQRGAGRLLYKWCHKPTERLKWRSSFGWRMIVPMMLGEYAMMARARRLPAIGAGGAGAAALECSFMTGLRFWYQTAFCAHSLARHWQGAFRPTFFDDGTLRPRDAAVLKRVFPESTIVLAEAIKARLDEHLPAARFPRLRGLREEVPMMRKLIDLRAASNRWQLYLDSDMLFFRKPDLLFAWTEDRLNPFAMQDTVHGYCAPAHRLTSIFGFEPAPFVNAGVLNFDDGRIDWERVEGWCGQFSPEECRHILFEQSLSAALLSLGEHRLLPADDYRVIYQTFDTPPDARLLHYVHRAKATYLVGEWRRYLRDRRQTPVDAT